MSDKKHIDDLITRRETHESELKQIGDEIRKSGRNAAVAFIDLSDSTALKESAEPEVWLGYVYRFIRSIERLVNQFEGIVVKRIGDEVLATFESVSQCEQFLKAVQHDHVLREYDFKIAADYGEVFFIKFGEGLEDDPYGRPVDRCARIAKLAQAGTVLCSESYYENLGETKDDYLSGGVFSLAGIAEAQRIFIHLVHPVQNRENYLQPLLYALNDSSMQRPRYQFVSRKFKVEDFEFINNCRAHPFLIRELLNVPKLPFSAPQLWALIKESEHEDEAKNFIGYLVEWEAEYSSYDVFADCLTAFMSEDSLTIILKMPLVMTDAVRLLKKKTRLKFRGIITGIDYTIKLDFVDLEVPEKK